MKTHKKLLSSLLALVLSLYALPTVWAEDITQQVQDMPENSLSDTIIANMPHTEDETGDDNAETDTLQTEEIGWSNAETDITQEDEIIDGNEDGISTMSLLPVESDYVSVTIDRSNGVPPELADKSRYSFFVREALGGHLTEKGIISNSEAYDGVIMYSFDNEVYKEIGWNDVISLESSSDYVYFILGNDQLNIDNICYHIYVTIDFNSAVIRNSKLNLFNKSGKDISIYSDYIANDMTGSAEKYFNTSYNISLDSLEENEYVGFLITLPENYSGSNVEIYEGFIHNEDEIGSAVNVVSQIINDGTDKEPYEMDKDYNNYKKDLTFVITEENGNKNYYPIRYNIYVRTNRITMELSSYLPSYFIKKYVQLSYNEFKFFNYIKIVNASDFDRVNISAKSKYYKYENGYDIPGDLSEIDFACFGYYTSKDDALQANEKNIKNSLFGSSGEKIDFSKCEDYTGYLDDGAKIKVKYICITAIDKNGVAYHTGEYLGISDKIKEDDSNLSDDTYFNINGARKTDDDDDYKRLLNDYIVGSSNDSYFKNGYQTVFLLDRGKPLADGTTIYPEFSKSSGVNIYAAGYNGTQTAGESPVTFEDGKAVQYSAASESGTHLKNYWVTFVTQQSGPKLFVNAVNNPDHYSENGKPQREVFLNPKYDYKHDIFFANIGDEELSGIKVSLSGDAQGVKLDDYWTVIDTSVGTLNPFTKTSNPDNIAKIRLVPVSDDYFGDISGTLTISTANGGSQEIELTGIAGIPKITTDKLYDGIKYVPYSGVIMTNSMYGSDSMSFSLDGGRLPDGLELRPNGEIYGIPKKTGEFTFTVKTVYNGAKQDDGSVYSCSQTYTIVIADNTDENVDAANTDEQGHPMIERVSKYITVYYSSENNGKPIVDRIEIDSDLFWSEGALRELQDFYIDGIRLTKGSDYIAEEGSTKITVRAQTFGHIGITGSEVPHTLAAEFRTADTNELKRSAQNVYLDYEKIGGNDNPEGNTGNTSGNNNSNNTGSAIPVFNQSSGTVNAVVSIVDANGNPVSDLELELHSKPKYASTDSSGAAKFDSVEFGRHTLYVKNLSNNKKISKTFSITSGSNTGIKGSVITASEGETISLAIEYDGSEIKILSVAEDVSSGSGVNGNSEIAFVISKNIFLKRILILTVIFAAVILASILAIRKKFLTK